MSAGEIIRYLTRHGSARVARVAMLGTITPSLCRSESNPAGAPAEYFETFRRTQLMRDLPQWIEDNLPPFLSADTPTAMRAWVRNMALSASMKALVDCNRAIERADFSAELRELRVPALLIHGTRDVTCPLEVTAERTVALMPRAQLSAYDGAPHGLFLTHMERVNAELLAFARG
jgi:non-heme chloroperoxidase